MTQRVSAAALRDYTARLFSAAGLSAEDAGIVADALVTTDLRGIDSHGVAHIPRYIRGLQNGSLNGRPNIRILRETPSTAMLDADHGLGFLVGYRAMQIAIAKAKTAGSGWVSAHDSTHYGAAGYWASLALPHDLIGFSLCTSTSRIAPTFGARGMVGTNPIALAVPAGREPPFLLDMATSVVPMGKLEIHLREDKPLPEGWVVDINGKALTDPHEAYRRSIDGDVMLLPLGGAGETWGGHKGYGLGFAVEIMSHLLAGYAGAVAVTPGREPGLGQFYGALSVDAFQPADDFKAIMDNRLREYKTTPPLPGHERVLVAGQKEWEKSQERQREGIPLHDEVLAHLREVGASLGVPFPG
jgi:LDH2 family malate/lactate/ureidoglycolate dehydrogenase